jgi:hypothetical protein
VKIFAGDNREIKKDRKDFGKIKIDQVLNSKPLIKISETWHPGNA